MTRKPTCNRRISLTISLAVLALCGCTKPPSSQRASTSPAAAPAAATPAQHRANATDAVPVESPLVRLMRQLDRNGDGRVSREEHADVARQMFDAMDADHDGEVTAAEMDAIRRDLYGADRTAAAQEIAQVDNNHDSMLSAEEHATATGVIFDQINTDRDGFLTLAELQAAETAEATHKPQ